MKEVIEMIFEFVLSLVILIGGGFLIFKNIAPELCAGIMGTVVAYWFTNRTISKLNNANNQKGNGNGGV
jgi:hypothetical protein